MNVTQFSNKKYFWSYFSCIISIVLDFLFVKFKINALLNITNIQKRLAR